MRKLTLTNHNIHSTVVLENDFIDHYMPAANGEFVKVYLLLLRHVHDSSSGLDISDIADKLNLTEKDVRRALEYWRREGLIDFEMFESPALPGKSSSLLPALSPAQPGRSDVPNIQDFKSRKELEGLFFIAEQYLGKTLSLIEVDAITYFYEKLHMSADLIDYLIEYCVENGHKSIHYIQKVALSWNEHNITTVEAAKSCSPAYNKDYFAVLKAFCISGRVPASSEIAYMEKWLHQYNFSLELVLEACNRTMSTIHQPSFEYANGILEKWNSENVSSISDVLALDASHTSKKASEKRVSPKKNHFNNFEGRSYDMNDLERKLIQ